MEDIVSLEEDYPNKVVYITTAKRASRIKVYVPENGFPFWKIGYEGGNEALPELGGVYTSKRDAVKAATEWLKTVRPTEAAKHLEIFGEKKEPPVLKRKPVRAARDKTVNG